MKQLLKKLSLLLLLGCCFACARKAGIPAGEIPLNHSASQEFAQTVLAQLSTVASARALYRTTVTYEDKRSSFRYSLLCAPEKMRLEMLPLNSAYALSIVIVNDGNALLLDTQDKTANYGSSAKELLKKNLGIPLGIEELCAHLLGRPSALEYQGIKEGKVPLSAAENSIIARPRNHKLVFLADSGLISYMEVFSEYTDKQELSANFSDIQSFEGVRIPSQVDFNLSSIDATVAMKLVAFSAAKVLDTTRFSLEVPAGYKIAAER